MRVLIAADMEGIAGIDDFRVCSPAYWPSYSAGCELMTDEVLVALGALRDGGADQIVVGDWHMVGTNIQRARLPEGVDVHPIADLALTEDEPLLSTAAHGPIDGIVMIGHHASQNNTHAFSSHTFVWGMEVLLDGESLSETQVYAQAAVAEEIPILVAAGDRWLLEDLGDAELGDAELLAVKEGLSRTSAQSIPPAQAEELLAGAIERALDGDPKPPPARDYPAELVVRQDGKELLRTAVTEPRELLAGVSKAFKESDMNRDYRMLTRVFPAGDGQGGKPIRRRLGAMLAAKKIRAAEAPWLANAGLTPAR